MQSLGRRHVLAGATAIALGFACKSGSAQTATGQGLLAKLRAAKKVRVGIANQPPFSALNPDGTLTGAAPTVSKKIMERLGVPEMEGFIATYGELIPGMMADRWDFVSASLTITPARCGQVKFADPLIYDGTAIAYLKETGGPAPTKIGDIAKLDIPFGVLAGGADLRATIAAGVSPANIMQFESDQATIDALLAHRMKYGLATHSALQAIMAQRNIQLELVYPLPDDPARGSSCAFRPGDTDLYDAYQTELRAMKESGEYLSIIRQFGYDTPPELMKITAEQACAM
jgi:polar amino acid transport system substrate-binding protein